VFFRQFLLPCSAGPLPRAGDFLLTHSAFPLIVNVDDKDIERVLVKIKKLSR